MAAKKKHVLITPKIGVFQLIKIILSTKSRNIFAQHLQEYLLIVIAIEKFRNETGLDRVTADNIRDNEKAMMLAPEFVEHCWRVGKRKTGQDFMVVDE